MADIVLDVPLAYIMLDRFIERCNSAGFLTEKTIKNMPSRYKIKEKKKKKRFSVMEIRNDPIPTFDRDNLTADSGHVAFPASRKSRARSQNALILLSICRPTLSIDTIEFNVPIGPVEVILFSNFQS